MSGQLLQLVMGQRARMPKKLSVDSGFAEHLLAVRYWRRADIRPNRNRYLKTIPIEKPPRMAIVVLMYFSCSLIQGISITEPVVPRVSTILCASAASRSGNRA